MYLIEHIVLVVINNHRETKAFSHLPAFLKAKIFITQQFVSTPDYCHCLSITSPLCQKRWIITFIHNFWQKANALGTATFSVCNVIVLDFTQQQTSILLKPNEVLLNA